MIFDIFAVVVLIAFPSLSMFLAKKSRIFEWLGPVVICYLFGIILGNLPLWRVSPSLLKNITEVTILLAIPLLLFSVDFIKWMRLAKKTVISFLLAIVSIIATSIFFAQIFKYKIPEIWKIAGMLVGVYTGGTPNMSAIGIALGVKKEIFILLNGADVLVSSIYLMFLMTIAQKTLLLFLPPFKKDNSQIQNNYLPENESKNTLSISKLFSMFFISFAIVILSVGFSFLVFKKIIPSFVILAVTTFAICISFSEKIRNISGSYEVGQYLLLIFCVSIGTVANVKNILSTSGILLSYCAAVVFGSVFLHFFLSFLFRIDADTTIITSVACVFSPAFVGPVASVLKNKEIIVSGIGTGLVGFAIGNYLGLLVAFILK